MKRFLHITQANFPTSSSAREVREMKEEEGHVSQLTIRLMSSEVLNAAEILGTSRTLEACSCWIYGRCLGWL